MKKSIPLFIALFALVGTLPGMLKADMAVGHLWNDSSNIFSVTADSNRSKGLFSKQQIVNPPKDGIRYLFNLDKCVFYRSSNPERSRTIQYDATCPYEVHKVLNEQTGKREVLRTGKDTARVTYDIKNDSLWVLVNFIDEREMPFYISSRLETTIPPHESLGLASGDINGDGTFDSRDLVLLMVNGKYETGQPATYFEGDLNGDGVFDSKDLVYSFQMGTYAN